MWAGWIESLKTKGVKPDEIEWSGVQDWLKLQTGKVTKADVSNYLSQNGVQVQETVLSDDGQRKQYINELNQLSRADLEARAEDAGVDVDSIDGNRTDIVNAIVEAEEGDMDFGSDRSGGASKYSQYQLPGGTNYREVLLTLPSKANATAGLTDADRLRLNELASRSALYGSEMNADEKSELASLRSKNVSAINAEKEQKSKDYKSSHWDAPNVLAHIRVNDRVDADGNKVLFVEEVQADYGQDYKKQKDAINKAVDSDFNGIIERMKKAGVLAVECD
jgi:hypothetical protein